MLLKIRMNGINNNFSCLTKQKKEQAAQNTLQLNTTP